MWEKLICNIFAYEKDCRKKTKTKKNQPYTPQLTSVYNIKMKFQESLFCINWLIENREEFLHIDCTNYLTLHSHCIHAVWAASLSFLAHLSWWLTRCAYRLGLKPASVCTCVRLSVCLFTLSNMKHEYLWNMNISETSGPIAIKFYMKHHWQGGNLH